MTYPLLDQIQEPSDLRKLAIDSLPALAQEIRDRIIDVVSKNGGHLSSNLGITELTIALHYVFDFSKDRLLWDVGHQCYPHKLLTGRHRKFDRLRQAGGISGFPSTHESPYDQFQVGHAGTAIATAVGLARGDGLLEQNTRVAAVVGDASIVNGLAFEGLNQAGLLKRQLLVILNDNQWGISPTQGAMAEHLAKFRVGGFYEGIKSEVKKMLSRVPLVGKPMYQALTAIKEGLKTTLSPHQIFEQMGFIYVGPTDGHDIAHLIELLTILKDVEHPVLLHVHTQKGKGAEWACAEPCKFHSPMPFVVTAGKAEIKKNNGKEWTTAFADALLERAAKNPRLVAMTAGMPDGTGLAKVRDAYPRQVIDVGIAESCLVTMAAGMAKAGLRPICAVYSTFLQRALDQIWQEVALQGLPVIFCIDRAGLVGGDGAVHHGFMDIAYLRPLPGMVLMAPADESELGAALDWALAHDKPCAIRYPRDNVPKIHWGNSPAFELGVSKILRDGHDATILAYGSTAAAAMEAAELLGVQGFDVGVVNARFAKPIDRNMLRTVLNEDRPVVTVEDHSLINGFGSAILEAAQEEGLHSHRIVRIGLPPDRLIAQGSRKGQLAEVGLDAAGIAQKLASLLVLSSNLQSQRSIRSRTGTRQSQDSGLRTIPTRE